MKGLLDTLSSFFKGVDHPIPSLFKIVPGRRARWKNKRRVFNMANPISNKRWVWDLTEKVNAPPAAIGGNTVISMMDEINRDDYFY